MDTGHSLCSVVLLLPTCRYMTPQDCCLIQWHVNSMGNVLKKFISAMKLDIWTYLTLCGLTQCWRLTSEVIRGAAVVDSSTLGLPLSDHTHLWPHLLPGSCQLHRWKSIMTAPPRSHLAKMMIHTKAAGNQWEDTKYIRNYPQNSIINY